jgi:7-cyano-7-deazaguanine synthase
MKAVVIVSGGLDSVTLLHQVVKTSSYEGVFAISFAYGQRHEGKELACAHYHAQLLGVPLNVVELPFLRDIADQAGSALVNRGVDVPHVKKVMGDPQPVTYVPNRNMMFLSIVAAYAEAVGAEAILYGAQRHDIYGYWDTTPQFLGAINQVFLLNRKKPIQILAPFVQDTKGDIVRRGVELGIDYARTWSCYNGLSKPCGTCSTCAERIKGFTDNGLVDPLMEAA